MKNLGSKNFVNKSIMYLQRVLLWLQNIEMMVSMYFYTLYKIFDKPLTNCTTVCA